MTKPFDSAAIQSIDKQVRDWEANEVASFIKRAPESKSEYLTGSGMPVQRTYTPLDIKDTSYEDIGLPGQYPFTRGPYPTMYRGRNWTMRQIAGFGTAKETNGRFKYLIKQGQTGLSIDFDMPTLMGYDSDHFMSEGEVGREGVAIDTLADMEELFEDIDLTKISVSMTINPSAWILYAMYIALAEKRGYDLNDLSGTIQNDILKEYIAQKEWIYPVRPSVRLVRDCIQYGSKHMRRYNPINISGYHISEAGSTAVQEVAYTMATTMEYVKTAMDAGVDIDEFGPRLSFFFVSQADFFEEIAKFRAARRIYAKIMREKFGATKPEASRLRFHAQTAAATLTKPQYTINPVRTALQALSAVLGGAQSLHTNGMDEAFAIPTEEAMRIALRTQQIIAHETNVTQVVDPIGGSYYVESLTDQIEKEVWKILDEVEELGGTLKCIDDGYFQRGISDSAYDFALRKASGERPVIGVNMFVDDEADPEIEIHPHDPETERRQIERLNRVRAERDEQKVQGMLAKLKEQAADESVNLMPLTIDLVKEGASMGDIVETLKEIWGTYRETPVI
ncbi:methylmalonyl-CoA mutase family protein [Alkalilimnicola sp. S0819]|uniref:methylmalonyl-CoA mutase family protein n=1 Tax=Alkalilimnicola sp. S0819 TaxID=2613922 RepID=UPI00126140DA|nr:methylmalonyl-CoA mutase family protein [Alkalilimnicola sp. S0819]KAB7622796.1 methylmalonyl-CoA mutase family protein [Alkalilimnicola sp. S0819]MPQ17292.1 methylmalonyl-CoA mutase [Alkalilimnicola sp. S0819]